MNEQLLQTAILRAKTTPTSKVEPPKAKPVTEANFVIEALSTRVKYLEGIVGKIVNELGIKISPSVKTFPTIKRIVAITSLHYETTPHDIIGHGRHARITEPRHVAMYLSKRLTLHSYPTIAKAFDGRDHTTIMHAVNKIEMSRKADARLDQTIALLSRELMELKPDATSPVASLGAAPALPSPDDPAGVAPPLSGAA
jgi:chromosomal replication initiator protein